MKITEAKVKKTDDIISLIKPAKSDNVGQHKMGWRDWLQFPRWDICKVILDATADKEKLLKKAGKNLICESTYSGKHHITYWKYYESADEYAKDHE